jgi:Outer membrane lipoprotein carrier protein LolA-like
MRAMVLVLLLLVARTAWAAPELDLARLMELLAQSPSAEVPYVEKKFSALLSEPVVSSGTLAYRRPDMVQKNVLAPRKESFRIEGREIVVTRNGKQRRLALSSEPLLAAFAASLLGVLSGDAKQLGEYYRLALEGTESGWKLAMTPIDDEIARYVKGIVVSGRGGIVREIEVDEASGDRSVMTVK